ncbi:unnamed protein product [Eruca vesicaria subsp. sativa]|uniref:Uncharacterized protein n=1 Tax=Eruca vesicaria subsp. sativa TaxID=29727 RepID=A0ABC8LNQ1_ERUVS|nr:unnamed protein product [Eruca vesicaria subsp. sativa]
MVIPDHSDGAKHELLEGSCRRELTCVCATIHATTRVHRCDLPSQLCIKHMSERNWYGSCVVVAACGLSSSSFGMAGTSCG